MLADLSVSADILQAQSSSAELLRLPALLNNLAPRAADAHKGDFGHVMVIGGDTGFGGAALMAAEAAARTGAGLVSIATRPEHIPAILARRPEVMACGVVSGQELEPWLARPTVLVVGPGLGRSPWSEQMLQQAVKSGLPLVLDADALNAVAADSALQTLLRQRSARGWFTVITPHPLEAARLLGSDTAVVMVDRLQAARTLSERFGVVCVLKGSGTVIAAPGQTPRINPTGNAALATAGTGDVLAGMIGCTLALPGRTVDRRLDLVAHSVFQHGWLADHWAMEDAPPGNPAETLSASRLAARVRPMGGV